MVDETDIYYMHMRYDNQIVKEKHKEVEVEGEQQKSGDSILNKMLLPRLEGMQIAYYRMLEQNGLNLLVTQSSTDYPLSTVTELCERHLQSQHLYMSKVVRSASPTYV